MNRSATAMHHLVHKLKGKADYILLISEPNINKGRITGLPKHSKVYPIKKDERQRAIAICSKNIISSAIEEVSSKDCAVFAAKIKHGLVLICSFYCDIKDDISKHQ